jgi:hypothetical protein
MGERRLRQSGEGKPVVKPGNCGGKIFRNKAKLFFSVGWRVGYKMAHANHRRPSPAGFRNVAFVFKRAALI